MEDRNRKMTGVTGKIVLFIITIVSIASAVVFLPKFLSRGSSVYYVDCETGSDENNGEDVSTAWQTLEKANRATLRPGDQLLLKRGCAWEGTLNAFWNGRPDRPILIGAYGEGELPRIQNKPDDLEDRYHNSVDIQGSYLIIENIEAAVQDPPTDPNCQDNPVGFYAGFNFRNPNETPNGGSNNTLRYIRVTGHTAGVHLNPNTHHNRVLRSVIVGNNVMNVLTPKSENASDDIGAWGILVRGDNHEVAYNYLSENHAWCTYDTNPQGNAIELFEAQNTNIHHNVSVDDRVFSEIGGTADKRSSNNIYAYNLVRSSVEDAHFLITRGSGSEFGPVENTKIFNNTVYLTGEISEGIVCGAGCSSKILTAQNNIIWAENKTIFADGPFEESHNIFWSSDHTPLVQFLGFGISNWSIVIDPGFINPKDGNFRLKDTSAAVDAGILVDGSYKNDLDCQDVPQSGIVDIGAFEFQEKAVQTPGWSADPLMNAEDFFQFPICP